MTSTAPRSRTIQIGPVGWALILVLACLLPYLPGLTGPFMLDDTANLGRVRIGGRLSWESLYWGMFNNPSGMLRRPLVNLSLLLQQTLGDGQPFGFKLVNLLLHGINGYLVWRLAGRVIGMVWPMVESVTKDRTALLAAMLWTIHPLQVSTVLYVVQRMTLLSSTFILLALLIALRPLPHPGLLATRTSGVRHALIVGGLALVALLSKEIAVLVPAMLLSILAATPLTMRRRCSDTEGKVTFTRIAVWLPLLFAIPAIAILWPRVRADYASRSFTVGERLISESQILIDYVARIFVPLPARMGLYLDDAVVITTTAPGWWVGPMVIAIALGAAIALRRRWPLLAFAVFWFAACHLLESTFIPLELEFEHRNYLALFGPAMLIAGTIMVAGKNMVSPRIAALTAILAIALLGGMTFLRSSTWSNEMDFVSNELLHHPDSARVQMEAARLESTAGGNEAAYRRILATMDAHPDDYAPMLYAMQLGCAGYPVPWERLNHHVREHPDDNGIRNQALYDPVLNLVARKVCRPEFNQAFDRHVNDAIAFYSGSQGGQGLQFFLMAKAQIESNLQRRSMLVRRAIEADPQEIGPRVQLASMELALGNRAQAIGTIKQLDRMIPRWHPDRMYVRELQRLVAKPSPP
jgi:protein O-mannosyl-transferase